MLISEALRLLRVFHDLKQIDLAKRLGISRSHLSEIEKAVKTPSFDLIERYANEFRIPVSSIVFFAEAIPGAERGSPLKAKISKSVIGLLQLVERKANVENGVVE
jgi:transcriptional regulator with XRE-family HTH domain